METLAQIYARHSGPGKFTDRNSVHSYIPVYEELLAPYRDTKLDVLEIGVYDGFGLRAWVDFFHNATVHGIDVSETPLDRVDLRPMIAEGKFNIHIFDATDAKVVAEKFSGKSFSVIVEDANHNIDQQVQLFKVWREYMAPGGLYCIEDVECIDLTRPIFENLGFSVLDRRGIKKRYDDVLLIYRKPV